ncbi:hypothetical protein D3C74_166390 [compost metagenome]
MSGDQNDISLYEEGLLKHVCPRCHFIFKHSTYPVACTNCGLVGSGFVTFGFYPNIEAVDILYSVFELRKHAKSKQNEIIKKIVFKLKEAFNRDYDFSKVDALLGDFIDIMNDPKNLEEDSQRRINAIKVRLNLENEEQSEQAYSIVGSGDNINRLNKSIVILCASLIEIMFKEYMFKLIEHRTTKFTAQKLADMLKHHTVEGYLSQIDVFFEKGFKTEMNAFQSGFYDKWASLRKNERNKLIHKNSIHISFKKVEEVIALAKESIDLFSNLSNSLISNAQ